MFSLLVGEYVRENRICVFCIYLELSMLVQPGLFRLFNIIESLSMILLFLLLFLASGDRGGLIFQ